MAEKSVKSPGLDQRFLNDRPRVQGTLHTCFVWHEILRYLELTLKKKNLDFRLLERIKNNNNNKEMEDLATLSPDLYRVTVRLQRSTGCLWRWGPPDPCFFYLPGSGAAVYRPWVSSVVLNQEYLGEL